jgi:hypothetical protein
MANEIYESLRLTAVGCPSDVALPSLKFLSKVLSRQASDIGMPGEQLESEITNTFALRVRNEEDPRYSLESLKESTRDILGLYQDPEITLFVDSCSRVSTDLSVSIDDLLRLVLIHELAHHATAWAQIADRYDTYTWADYNECNGDPWTSVHEFFAQALSFLWIAKHQKELLGAFRTFSRYQPSIYRAWEVFDAFARNKVPLHSIRDILKDLFLASMKSGCGKRSIIRHEDLFTSGCEDYKE